MEPITRKCETCEWWDSWELTTSGECRKNLPVPRFTLDNLLKGRWPQTSEYEWCGEWKDKGEADGVG